MLNFVRCFVIFISFLFTANALADDVETYLERCTDKREEMERIFEEEGVPKEMFALCLVESGCRDNAESSQTAKGICQLLPSTARNYGLIVNKHVDERLDWRKNTRASAKYIKHLLSFLGDKGVYKGYLLGGHNYIRLEKKAKEGTLTKKERLKLQSAKNYDLKIRSFIKRIYGT